MRRWPVLGRINELSFKSPRRFLCLISVSTIITSLTVGPWGPRERPLLGALFWSLCCGRAPVHWLPLSVATDRFSTCMSLNCPGTTTTPHLDSTLPWHVTHHGEEPLEAVRCAALGPGTGVSASHIILHFSFLFTHHAVVQSTPRAYRGITHK